MINATSRSFSFLAFSSVVIVLALAAAIYWPGLSGSFFFDDEPNILQIEALRLDPLSLSAIREVLASGLSGPSGRPVAQLSFAFNHFFSGFDPFAFKATNLAIHGFGGILIFLLGLNLLRSVGATVKRGRVQATAVLLAALWLLHPIQLTPVLHVVQRMTSLSAVFLFGALLLHVMGRERGGRAGIAWLAVAWGLLWPLSYFSKETGALFPLFVLSWELIIRNRNLGGLDRFARGLAGLVLLGAMASVVYAALPAGRWLWAGYDLRAFSPVERLLTEGRVLWFYLGLILLPRLDAFGLYHDDIAASTGLFDPWTTLPAWLALAGLAWMGSRVRANAPLIFLGIAWFLIGHLLESTVLPLEIVHEHRNYVPLFGVLLAAAGLFMEALDKIGPRKTLGVALAAVSLVYCAFVTGMRAHQFGDEIRRTQIESQHHPESARAHYDAGRAIGQLGASADAEAPAFFFARTHFERASELDASFKLGWLGLIHLNCRAGRDVESAWIEELARRLQQAPFGPGDESLMYSLKEMAIVGTLCLDRVDIELLFAAARANPSVTPSVRAKLHSWLADYLALGMHDAGAARTELDQSLAIAPYNPSNRLKRAQLSFLLGEHAETRRMLGELREATLNHAERKTLSQLRACLEGANPSAACIAR